MIDDDWWTRAVADFGIDAPAEPRPIAVSEPFAPTPSAAEDVEPPAQPRRRRAGLDLIVIAVVAIGVALLLRTFVVQQFAVDGQSMLGTLHSGDRVIVNKLSYDFRDPRHGDSVVLEYPNGSFQGRRLSKRMVRVPEARTYTCGSPPRI